MFMLFRTIEEWIFVIFKSGNVKWSKTNTGQKGSNRLKHLNIRIAKNNLTYPLVRDTFSVLGNSKCEVLSVLDLKDVFHSL